MQSTSLPITLVHLVFVINAIEMTKRGMIVQGGNPCAKGQRALDLHVDKAFVERRVLRRTVSWRLWRSTSLDDWVRSIAHSARSVKLVSFPLSEAELPRWVQVAFSNAGAWGMAIEFPTNVVFVRPQWRPHRGNAMFDVAIRGTSVSGASQSMDVNDALVAYHSALQRMIAMAQRLDRDSFVARFDASMQVIESGGPITKYAGALLSESLFSPGARALLEAIGCSSVFGAMGSWTDVLIQDPHVREEYNSETGAFFDVMVASLLSAVNHGRLYT